MAFTSSPFGVPVVGLGVPDLSTALPTSTFGAISTMTAGTKTPVYYNKNSVNKKVSGTYTVSISLLGYDAVNQGYTVNTAPTFITSGAITSGNGILVRLPNADFVSNMSEAFAMAVWIQQGSANAQLAKFGFINPAVDFSTLILSEPLAQVPFVSTTVLTAATTSAYLGSRAPYSITFPQFTPTTDGVHYIHKATKVQVRPDNTVDYDQITARGTEVHFSVLSDSPQYRAQSIGGNAWQYADTDSTTVTEQESDLYAAVSNTPGNLPIMSFLPPDNNGGTTYDLLLGNLTVNTNDVNEDHVKTAPFKLDFTLAPASLDTLIQGLHTGIRFLKE